jgi:hypothetical protein
MSPRAPRDSQGIPDEIKAQVYLVQAAMALSHLSPRQRLNAISQGWNEIARLSIGIEVDTFAYNIFLALHDESYRNMEIE